MRSWGRAAIFSTLLTGCAQVEASAPPCEQADTAFWYAGEDARRIRDARSISFLTDFFPAGSHTFRREGTNVRADDETRVRFYGCPRELPRDSAEAYRIVLEYLPLETARYEGM